MWPLIQLLVEEYGEYLLTVVAVDVAIVLVVTAAVDVGFGGDR